MRRTAVAVALLAGVAGSAGAGEIYGKISSGGASVGEGVAVTAACAGRVYPPVTTDKYGHYHLVAQETGRCTLSVVYKGLTARLDVVSYDEAAQADVVLEVKNGTLLARRR